MTTPLAVIGEAEVGEAGGWGPTGRAGERGRRVVRRGHGWYTLPAGRSARCLSGPVRGSAAAPGVVSRPPAGPAPPSGGGPVRLGTGGGAPG